MPQNNRVPKADWASDLAPSMPVPPKNARLVRMGGFCFTIDGLAHDLSAAEAAEISHPPFGPATTGGQ